MYQFTTTTVLNTNLDSNGTTAKFTGSATELNVTRVNRFKKANILSINKRAYVAGVKEIATLVVPATTAGKEIRLDVDYRLSQSAYSEFANYSLDFKKPLTVSVIATGVIDTDGAALVAQVLKLKNRFGDSYFTATYNTGTNTITFTAKENIQRFYSIKLLEEAASYNSVIDPQYTLLATGTVTTPGVVGFGDDQYMISHIQIPTIENTRHFGINKEERPVLGGNYSQYTIRYSVPKDGNDGIIGNGYSITTHVFYVISTLVAAFETELDKLGITYGVGLTIDDASLANSATGQLTATNTVGAVVFSVTSGTSATVNASTGVVTADATIDGDTVVRATDALGNYAEVTVTVA